MGADPIRERAFRPNRIYPPHSRARQVLSLPATPPAKTRRTSRPLRCPPPRILRAATLLALFAAAMLVLHASAPNPHAMLADPAVVVVAEREDTAGDRSRDAAADGSSSAGGADSGGSGSERIGGESGSSDDGRDGRVDGAIAAEAVSTDKELVLPGTGATIGSNSSEDVAPTESRPAPAETPVAATAATTDGEGLVISSQEHSLRDPADFETFDKRTTLNYFHLHKTGGVSFKERLFDFFMRRDARNAAGTPVRVVDTCHMSGPARPALGLEARWSCDWGEIETRSERDRNGIDVILGHQYWERGAGYWLPNRDLRYFTVMRHPLHRKISFFYHFFVRNAGREEDSVTPDELIQFVLGKEMPKSPLVRDAGPGYYASRLWSDGFSGYGKGNTYIIHENEADNMVFNSIRRLRRNFVFIGLQTQEKASLCMLKKTVEKFATAHGITSLTGLDAIAAQRERMNTGSYALTGRLLWEQMTEEQRHEFKHVERVDLAIYKESVSVFHEMAKRFDCAHLVEVDNDDDKIAL